MLEPSETPLILFALLPKIIATMAFRKPHLKEKLQAWNLTEARAKAFKMFNAMLAPWFFFFGCMYLPAYRDRKPIHIHSKFTMRRVIFSFKFIGINFSQYSPWSLKRWEHMDWPVCQPHGVRWCPHESGHRWHKQQERVHDILGCGTFWNFTKRNGTGLRKN